MITTSRNNKSWINKKYKRGYQRRIKKCGYGGYGDYIESELIKMMSREIRKSIDEQIIKAIGNSI